MAHYVQTLAQGSQLLQQVCKPSSLIKAQSTAAPVLQFKMAFAEQGATRTSQISRIVLIALRVIFNRICGVKLVWHAIKDNFNIPKPQASAKIALKTTFGPRLPPHLVLHAHSGRTRLPLAGQRVFTAQLAQSRAQLSLAPAQYAPAVNIRTAPKPARYAQVIITRRKGKRAAVHAPLMLSWVTVASYPPPAVQRQGPTSTSTATPMAQSPGLAFEVRMSRIGLGGNGSTTMVPENNIHRWTMTPSIVSTTPTASK